MKKGALELSITAIVVLIIAITVLGFAIFFIKSLFGAGTTLLSGQLEKVKDTLKETFASEGISAGFDAGKDIKVKQGKPLDLNLGISNSDSASKCFQIQINCIQSTDIVTPCPSTIVGGDGAIEPWFSRLFSTIQVEGNDVTVIPTKLQVPSSLGKTTFQMKLDVAKETAVTTAGDCASATYATYASIPFFITVE